MYNMPKMRSPWVGMQATPEQMQMLQEQQMMAQPQMLLAQNSEPSALEKISNSFSDAMPINFGTGAPEKPANPAYPGLGSVFTDQVKKNKEIYKKRGPH